MDRRERIENLPEALNYALSKRQSEMWTSLPGHVLSFNPVERTCVVQPDISVTYIDPVTNIEQVLAIPYLEDCPVVFFGGGGFVMTVGLEPGDECLIVFSSRCIDAWWQLSGVQPQLVARMHDLNDGFVIPGPRSLPAVEPAISTNTLQIRSRDGKNYVEMDQVGNITTVATSSANLQVGNNSVAVDSLGTVTCLATSAVKLQVGTNIVEVDSTGNISITSSADVAISTPALNISGNLNITGNVAITGKLTVNGISLGTHHHVDSVGGNTGGPLS